MVPYHHALDQLRYQRATRPRQICVAHIKILGAFWAQETRLAESGLQFAGKLHRQQPDLCLPTRLTKCLA